MPSRIIAAALMLLAATASLQWAGASEQSPIPGAETSPRALSPAGVARSWGSDTFGQLGNGPPESQANSPVPVSGLAGVVQLSGGGGHTLALLKDGTVRAWGKDDFGELGNGGPKSDASAPVVVSGLSDVKAVAAGGAHSLALLDDGTVMAWGNDDVGQLGNGDATGDRASPILVNGLSDVVAIAAGDAHSLALLDDSTVMAWGLDEFGQLGDDDDLVDQATPVQVEGLSAATAISAGIGHSFALLDDGTVMAWGEDDKGQLGNGAPEENEPTPVPVSDLNTVSAVSAGGSHSLALLDGGTVMAWGSDSLGRLGNGGATTADQPAPVAVRGLSGVTAISAGGLHSLALLGDGTVMAWGHDLLGQVGNGPPSSDTVDPPEAVVNLSAVTAISAGNRHSLAIVATCLGELATIVGGAAGESINGTAGADVIHSGDGDDNVRGLGGSDVICAGDGDDTIDGGGGEDRVDGGAGVDTVKYPGGAGRNINLLKGTVSGEGPGRRLTAIENIKGSNGPDIIKGNNKANKLEGNKGNDTLRGNKGNDKLFGGRGTDTCDGGKGTDTADVNCETKKNIP